MQYSQQYFSLLLFTMFLRKHATGDDRYRHLCHVTQCVSITDNFKFTEFVVLDLDTFVCCPSGPLDSICSYKRVTRAAHIKTHVVAHKLIVLLKQICMLRIFHQLSSDSSYSTVYIAFHLNEIKRERQNIFDELKINIIESNFTDS